MTYRKLLHQSLELAKTEEQANALKYLLIEMSELSSSEFYLKYETSVPKDLITNYNENVSKYLEESIPIQHLLGYSYFCGRKFQVDDNVLIPRVETEELVENILMYYDEYFDNQVVNVLDLGTGSGCIAISLDLEESKMKVTGSDISTAALVVAQDNNNLLASNVDFIVSDLFKNISGKFDIIVSNPPYIPKAEVVASVVSKEPKVALYGGIEGIDFYELIIKESRKHLKEQALLAFEHGFLQKDMIKKIVDQYFPNAVVIQKKDMAGLDRMTFIGIGGVLK